MLDVRLYFLQRLSAIVMAPLVLGHLAMMIVAVRGGLSSVEILSRTQGSLLWTLFYGLFVLAVSVHAAIGVGVIISETFKPNKAVSSMLTLVMFLFLLYFGGRAVYAVTVV